MVGFGPHSTSFSLFFQAKKGLLAPSVTQHSIERQIMNVTTEYTQVKRITYVKFALEASSKNAI